MSADYIPGGGEAMPWNLLNQTTLEEEHCRL
jgi:hypothetical protein